MSTTLRALGKASLKAKVAKSKQFVGDAPIEVAEAVKVVRTSAGSSSSASLSPAAGTQVDVPATDNSKILAEDMKSGRRGRSAAKSVEPPSDAKPSTRGKRRAAADETPAGSLASDWSIAPSEADPAVNATSSEADDKENGITAAAETKPGKSAKRKLVDAPPSKTRGKASNVLPTVVEDAVPIEEQGKPSKRTVASWSLETSEPVACLGVSGSPLPTSSSTFKSTLTTVRDVAAGVLTLFQTGVRAPSTKSFQELHREAVLGRRAVEVEVADPAKFDPMTSSRDDVAAAIRRLERELKQSECSAAMKVMDAQTKLTMAQSELKSLQSKMSSQSQLVTSLEDTLDENMEQITLLQTRLIEDTQRLREEVEQVREEGRARVAAIAEEIEGYKARMVELVEAAKSADARAAAAEEEKAYAVSKYSESDAERKRLLEEVLTLKGSVRVFCRVRPPVGEEMSKADGHRLFTFPGTSKDCTAVQISEPPAPGVDGRLRPSKTTEFGFNRVFSPIATQEEMFEECRALVSSMADGNRVCVFAYGQTGSGKTYTMQGPETADGTRGSSRGLIPRSIAHLYAVIKLMNEDGWTVDTSVEIVEVYNETFRDLLNPSSAIEGDSRIELRADKTGAIRLTGVSTVVVKNAEQALETMAIASRARATASTKCNEHSSRSHMVFTLRLEGTHTATGQTRSGVLNMVDLAGSERLSKSLAADDPKTLKETQNINQSLSVFGQVFSALMSGGKAAHVPFRSSKLTHLLQSSLTGGSKALMICNLSPSVKNCQESMCTLKFASNVTKCVTG